MGAPAIGEPSVRVPGGTDGWRTPFRSIDEVQDMTTRWLWTYNNGRPNIARGGISPKQKLALPSSTFAVCQKMGDCRSTP